MGNYHNIMGNLSLADQTLRRAVSLTPNNSDATNNLAHIVVSQGNLGEALYWSRHAVQIGGANTSVYKETHREIEALQMQ